ncbi:hypothetical protein [Nocardia salmonicida]|uniref:hypothetical protein n=1 Tax=Nocardia salmonicida TaxID=53431 RepID=UPI00340B31E2
MPLQRLAQHPYLGSIDEMWRWPWYRTQHQHPTSAPQLTGPLKRMGGALDGRVAHSADTLLCLADGDL